MNIYREPPPPVDKYGTKIEPCKIPLPCGLFAAMGYSVGKIREDGAIWFNAYLDGVEIMDGFTTASEAWDAIARYDDGIYQ